MKFCAGFGHTPMRKYIGGYPNLFAYSGSLSRALYHQKSAVVLSHFYLLGVSTIFGGGLRSVIALAYRWNIMIGN